MKKYVINFKNWPSISVPNIFMSPVDINTNDYSYIWFKSRKLTNMLFNIYKEEFYQGSRIYLHKPNNHYILNDTGFYDCYAGRKLSWKTFKEEICPSLLYTFEINDKNELTIYPINVLKNSEIFKNNRERILEL